MHAPFCRASFRKTLASAVSGPFLPPLRAGGREIGRVGPKNGLLPASIGREFLTLEAMSVSECWRASNRVVSLFMGGIGAAACWSLCGPSSNKGEGKAMNEGPLVNSALGIEV